MIYKRKNIRLRVNRITIFVLVISMTLSAFTVYMDFRLKLIVKNSVYAVFHSADEAGVGDIVDELARFKAFKQDEFAKVYLGELYSPLHDYFYRAG